MPSATRTSQNASPTFSFRIRPSGNSNLAVRSTGVEAPSDALVALDIDAPVAPHTADLGVSCSAVMPPFEQNAAKVGEWPPGASIRLGGLARPVEGRAHFSFSGITGQMPTRSVQRMSHWIQSWKGVFGDTQTTARWDLTQKSLLTCADPALYLTAFSK